MVLSIAKVSTQVDLSMLEGDEVSCDSRFCHRTAQSFIIDRYKGRWGLELAKLERTLSLSVSRSTTEGMYTDYFLTW